MELVVKAASLILLTTIIISFIALLKIHFFIKSRGKYVPWNSMHILWQFMEYYDLTKRENINPVWLKVAVISHFGGFFVVVLIMIMAVLR